MLWRRSPGFILKARWLLENWCARTGCGRRRNHSRRPQVGQSSSHKLDAPPEKNLRFAFRAPHRVRLGRLHGTALGPPLPGFTSPPSPEEVCVAADLVQPEVTAERRAREFPELCARLEMRNSLPSERARNHHHPEDCGALYAGERAGGDASADGRHHRRSPLPRLSTSRAAWRLPRERRPRSLSKRSSHVIRRPALMASHDRFMPDIAICGNAPCSIQSNPRCFAGC